MLPGNVGKRIRNIRIELGLNMEDFGELFNPKASKGVVSNWENNYNLPNNERLKRIAELGGITVAELFDDADINPVEANETIGQVIRRLRKEKRVSLLELGTEAEISKGYLSQIENGDRNASVGILTKIAEVLGVSKLYLFKVAGYLDETDILSLVDENKRLRLALEFYADRKNHQVIWYDTPSTVGFDSGETARQALKACNFKYKEGE